MFVPFLFQPSNNSGYTTGVRTPRRETRPPWYPPSTTTLRKSEAFWDMGVWVRCVAQILEAGRVPREVWTRLGDESPFWADLRVQDYGKAYDQVRLAGSAARFCLDRARFDKAGSPPPGAFDVLMDDAAARIWHLATAEPEPMLEPEPEPDTRRFGWWNYKGYARMGAKDKRV